MQPSRPADEDRLPWLEPYREPKTPGKPLPRRGQGRPLAIGAVAAMLLAVGAGGYWLGQREEALAPPPRASQTIALPEPKPAPAVVAEAPPPPAAPVAVEPAPPPPAEAEKPKPVKKAAKRRQPPRKKIRSAGVERARLNAVRAAQERSAPRRATPRRPWPKMPSPGPAGQVIQLGAFSTPARANAAYYQRIARYKSLGQMPRVIVPVVSKPDGRVLYVLRLGTGSRQQSKTVCRNLRASGDHCLVIG